MADKQYTTKKTPWWAYALGYVVAMLWKKGQ